MYISKLSLYGFKSFAKKSEVYFGKGITSIVGPNGCGKTNIVDAIRWVIGEQKSSVLRADRNTDVIFNGTATRRPLNLSEVSLTIHNVSGKISLPYSDIVITRRVYRNGESEYFINNNLCRLKDITDLFIDTGMGANAYSIIELKMIEDILSENPEERKRLFEEAAGVNKYRVQRKAALRKLEATKEDLTRLNDIISEVESKVKNLRRQLKRYEKHQETTTKLIESEVLLATRKIVDIKEFLNPLTDKITKEREKLDALVSELNSKEEIWQTQQKDFENQETALEAKNRELIDVKEERNRFGTEELLLKEQLRGLNQTISRLQNDIKQYQAAIDSARDKQERLGKNRQEVNRQLEEKRLTFKAIEEQAEDIEQRYSKVNAEIQALQEERFVLSKRQAENSARFGNLQENIIQREKELASVEKQIVVRKNQEQEISAALDKLKETVSQLNIDLNLKRDNLEELTNRYNQYFESEQKLRAERREIESHLDRINNQIQFYNGIIQSKEGFSPGLQYVLDHLNDFPGINGALSDLLSVDPKYYLAVEAVLKDISRLLVAENRSAALQALDTLAKLNKGRVSIIPLDREFSIQPSKPIGDLIPLTDFVKCDKSLINLKQFLFSRIYCCRDDQFDDLIRDPNLDGVSLVSDKGRFRDANGIFSGGSRTAESNILIGRSEKLHQLESEADAVGEELKAVESQLHLVQKDLKQVLSQKDSLIESIKSAEQNLLNYQGQLHKEESRLTETISIQKTLNDNRISLQVLIDSFKERIQKEDPGKSNLDAEMKIIEDKIGEVSEKAAEIKQELDRVVADRQNKRIELINLENQSRNISDNLEITKRTIQRNLENIEKARAELSENQSKIGELEQRVFENRKQFDEYDRVVKEKEKEIGEFRNNFQTLRNRIQELNEHLYKLRRDKEILTNSVTRMEMDRKEHQAAVNEIRSVLAEKYNRQIPEDIPEDLPFEEELKKRVERYKRNLELIGMVNMAVKEEFEEENSRLKFLTEQRDDLIKSEEGLNDVIVQIDNIAREQFRGIFEKIRQNFKSTFEIFFKGGEADVKLVGDSDPLEAQIEIWACPSGKKMRSLKMLSAGEKALTAIALLFGIYQVKPSPFCILDEVDAPLDDENTRRFTNVIRTFSEKTQFIVVTHNKSTMSIADALYGVTMSESGISQIVSVKME
ncbi:MAG: chromosome segregation protein SMC [Candidatus Marinimicrobia bacterium]|nr:chromosome segregation protein SMC [Candidatus Neomarinimicrobiota bacterium]